MLETVRDLSKIQFLFKKGVKIIIIFSVLIFYILPLNATDYYVSTSGNNSNSGLGPEPNNAWRNIDYAVDNISPGDVIHVRSGTYTEYVTIDNSGTSSNYKTVTNYQDETVITRRSSITDNSVFHISANYWIIDNIEITNTWHPINVNRDYHHLIFRNLDMHDNGYSLLLNDGVHDVDIDYCDFYDPYDGNANLLGLRGEDNQISYNINITNCTFDGCGHNSINLFDSGTPSPSYFGLYDVLIENCTFSDDAQIAIATNYFAVERMVVRNCTFNHCARGIQCCMRDCIIENCTVTDHGAHFVYTGYDTPNSNITVKNIDAQEGTWGNNDWCILLLNCDGSYVYNITATGDFLGAAVFRYSTPNNGITGDHPDGTKIQIRSSSSQHGILFRYSDGNVYNVTGGGTIGSRTHIPQGSERECTSSSTRTWTLDVQPKGGRPSLGSATVSLSGNDIIVNSDMTSQYSDRYYFRAISDNSASDVDFTLDFGSGTKHLYIYVNRNKLTELNTNSSGELTWSYTGPFPSTGIAAIEFNTIDQSFYNEDTTVIGFIAGIVTDTLSNPIQGALVTTGSRYDSTDGSGSYIIINVPVDTYTVTASKSGYLPSSINNVVVLENDTTFNVDFQLSEASDLVGFWRFEHGSGTTAYDSSVNVNDGTIYGADWVSGNNGLALQFNGTDDYIEVPKSASLDGITDEITLIAWVKMPVNSRQTLLERWLCGTGVNERSFEFDIDTTGFVNFGLCGDGSSSDAVWLASNNVISADTWTHVAVTSDGSTMKIYINGVIDPNTAAPPTSIHPSATDLHIGRWEFSSGSWYYPYNGIMDELKIYSRALTQAEIIEDYSYVSEGNQGVFLPRVNKLYQASPNPFSDITTIRYQLSSQAEGNVSLRIYDIGGRLIKTLVNDNQSAGYYQVVWDGRNEEDKNVMNGVYFYRLTAEDYSGTRKLMLMR